MGKEKKDVFLILRVAKSFKGEVSEFVEKFGYASSSEFMREAAEEKMKNETR